MRKIILAVCVAIGGMVTVSAQGNLVIMNNTDCPINFTVFAHEAGGVCEEYQSDPLLSISAWNTLTGTGFHSVPSWWTLASGYTTTVPGTSLSNPAYWDAFKFFITDDPSCHVYASVGTTACGVATMYSSTCGPCSAAPGAPIYVSWVAIPPNLTYIFINY